MAPYADNRKALHDYEILETLTAGLELLGTEVKSVRNGRLNLRGSYVSIKNGEAFLVGADIPAYQPNNASDGYDPKRDRKLLLSKKELAELQETAETKGLTIIPLSVYNKGRFLKADIAVARGKKKFDKRQAIKKRDTERDLGRKI